MAELLRPLFEIGGFFLDGRGPFPRNCEALSMNFDVVSEGRSEPQGAQPVVGALGLQPGVISLGFIKRGAVERDHAGGFATEVVGNSEVSEVTPLALPHAPYAALAGIEDFAGRCRAGRCGASQLLALR